VFDATGHIRADLLEARPGKNAGCRQSLWPGVSPVQFFLREFAHLARAYRARFGSKNQVGDRKAKFGYLRNFWNLQFDPS